MKNIFFYLFLASLLAACGENQIPAGHTSETVTYAACEVYVGATDFYFKDANGVDVTVRVSNIPAERTTKIPDNLTDPNATEGPPGANPKLVGKEFLLIKNEKNEVVEIRQAK